jgi:UDP-N-acetylglucosamine transferase subunit ALG13
VIGQIGEPGPDGYRPRHFKWHPFIAPGEFDGLMARADLIIAHAGMGSIISALRNGKPIVIMPRRAALGEHRNDHQLATAARFAGRANIYVADDEAALPGALERATGGAAAQQPGLSPYADRSFLASLRNYILNGPGDRGAAPEMAGSQERAPG